MTPDERDLLERKVRWHIKDKLHKGNQYGNLSTEEKALVEALMAEIDDTERRRR